jgi:hypothetical protein
MVERMDGGPKLVIQQGELLAYDFFTLDDSSIGAKAYDQQVGKGDTERITTADIVAINTTMRARSPHSAWEVLTTGQDPLPWLATIPTDASLFDASDGQWATLRPALEAALAAAVAPHRNLSVATKVLHLKRPHLFPVLDSLVLQQVGATGRAPIAVLDHLRGVGRANRSALSVIRASLEKRAIIRSQVRILDALLWASHPAAGLAPKLGAWQHLLRRAD